jgi:hypothetical protein
MGKIGAIRDGIVTKGVWKSSTRCQCEVRNQEVEILTDVVQKIVMDDRLWINKPDCRQKHQPQKL